MNYLFLILSGVAMGLIAAVPIGPVNLICIRRSFAFGPLNGFVSGLGAALGDGVFAIVVGMGLTWVAQLIEGYSFVIELVGACILLYFGWHSLTAPPIARNLDCEVNEGAGSGGSGLVRAMASTFVLTVTNPATLVAFTAMFSGVGGLAGGPGSYLDAALVVAGVVGGSAGWWLVLTMVIGLFHARISDTAIRRINQGSGVLVGLFGLAVLVNLARKLFF